MRIAASVFVFVLLAFPASAELAWVGHYEQGVRLLEQRRFADAQKELRAALEARPAEQLSVEVGTGHYIDYLPHLYLTIAAFESGDLATAKAHLKEADKSGLAARSEEGALLLGAYRRLLNSSPKPRKFFDETRRKSTTLSNEEYEQIARSVANSCGLSGTSFSERNAPWYFHYELALELQKKGDNQRALDSLMLATERKPVPRRHARMYGMWLVDYLPYFQIARAQAKLGNWDCAANALEWSEKLGEVTPENREHSEFLSLQRTIEKNQ